MYISKRSGMDHTVLLANTPCLPQEIELAWVAGYILKRYSFPKTVTHPNTNRPIVRWPGIKLATIESQVRRPNH